MTYFLNHENCVSFIQSDEGPEHMWLALKPCLYETLFEFTNITPMNAKISGYIILKMLKVLAYFNQKNLAHRDVKLENILIEQNTFEPILSDYGFTDTL